MNERLQRLNIFIIGVVVTYTIFVGKVLAKAPLIHPLVDSVVLFLTSVGFYQLLTEVIFRLVAHVEPMLKLYWGRLFLDGLWSYTYILEGGTDNTIYFGVWKFEQSLHDTKVIGFGLTDRFTVRSRVRSVTDLIPNNGMYEFINVRNDSVNSAIDNYSRTSMYFELNKNKFLRYPTRMRGTTVVYGGPYNGRIYNNVFVKHEHAITEEDVIADLRSRFEATGKIGMALASPQHAATPEVVRIVS